MGIVADGMTGKEFLKELDRIANRSEEYRQTAAEGGHAMATEFNEKGENFGKAVDENGKLDKRLEGGMRLTGDLHVAREGLEAGAAAAGKSQDDIDDEVEKIVDAGWSNSTVSQRVDLAEDSVPTDARRVSDPVYSNSFDEHFVNTVNGGSLKETTFNKFLENRDLSATTATKLQDIYNKMNNITAAPPRRQPPRRTPPAGPTPQPTSTQNAPTNNPGAGGPNVTNNPLNNAGGGTPNPNPNPGPAAGPTTQPQPPTNQNIPPGFNPNMQNII